VGLYLPESLRVGGRSNNWVLLVRDPLAEDDIYNYVKLRQKLDIPIMATEYSPGGFHSYAIWVSSGATDYLRGDVAVKGGITPCLKTAHLAEAFQMNFELHHGGNSLNNVANLHIALAIPTLSTLRSSCQIKPEVRIDRRPHRRFKGSCTQSMGQD